MKLRVRAGKQTHHLLLEEEKPLLGDLRRKLSESLLPSLGYSSDAAFAITLNGRDALTEDDSHLESCGIISGDLIVLLIASAPTSPPEPPPTQALRPSASSSEASAEPIGTPSKRQRDSAGPGMENVAEVPELSSSRAGPGAALPEEALGCTLEPMLCSESVDGKIPHSLESLYSSAACASANDALMVVIHLLMLETGYVEQNVRSKVASMPEGWRRGDGVYKLHYSHPLCGDSSTALSCVPMCGKLIVNATLNINNCMKRLVLSTNSYISYPEQDNNVASVYRNLQTLSRLFKDQIVYPLLAATRQALELPDVFGLVVLPLELKLRIFRLLDVRSILSLSATCKDLQGDIQDPSLWRFLCLRDFRESIPQSLPTDWKELYKKNKKYSVPRWRFDPYPPDFPMPYRPAPYSPDLYPPNFPYPPGIIGGEYDQRPILPLARDPLSLLVPGRDPATGQFHPIRPRFDPLSPGRIHCPPRSEWGPFSQGGFF
ncbi:F-box only protein 7 [Pseudophryne corroboree]|uniref:F-box only protein 7 n=1 Tax=Pseudophryne corroboree TaxID=495146 RepID=UPI0030812624